MLLFQYLVYLVHQIPPLLLNRVGTGQVQLLYALLVNRANCANAWPAHRPVPFPVLSLCMFLFISIHLAQYVYFI